MSILFIILFILAIILLVGTMVISWLKQLQKSRFPQWTFLDYISVDYAKHLYLKYVKRQ
jgi:hypothetical protein